jgi:hypothetical protein
MAPHEPYLSFIVASRNDDHGGNILKRMRLFVNGLLEQTRRFEIPAELIFVEWNPPPDRLPLSEVLPRPSARDFLTLRFITVPASFHRRYRRASEIPLFQMIAKNVGIRRARGAYLLCTNIDLLLSEALMRLLSKAPLRDDTFYRANRCDVPDALDESWSLTQQLAWCERNVIRRLGLNPRYKYVNPELIGLQNKGEATKWLFDKLALAMVPFWSREKRAFYRLDTFACGDFTLMSRQAWFAIEGYLELDLYSLHVDSLGLIAATALGFRQHVFPLYACTYHMDHASGWETLSPLDKIRFLEERPAMDYSLVYDVGLYLLSEHRGLGLNSPAWGYAGVDFEEREFTPGSASAAQAVAATTVGD